MTTSQPRARFRPAPAATPSTAAIVGFVIRCRTSAAEPTICKRSYRPATLCSAVKLRGIERHIGTRTESTTGPREDQHSLVRQFKIGESIPQTLPSVRWDGVLSLGAVDRDGSYRIMVGNGDHDGKGRRLRTPSLSGLVATFHNRMTGTSRRNQYHVAPWD